MKTILLGDEPLEAARIVRTGDNIIGYDAAGAEVFSLRGVTDPDALEPAGGWDEPQQPPEVAALQAELAALKARSAEIEAALNIVPPWQPDIAVKANEVYSHAGSNWRVVQDHTTASHWEPGSPGLDALYAPA